MNILLVNADSRHSQLSGLLNELAVCTLWDAGHSLKVIHLGRCNISSEEQFYRLQWCDFCILSFPVLGASVPVELKSWISLMLRGENLACLPSKKIMLTIVAGEPHLSITRTIRTLFEDLVPNSIGFAMIAPFLAYSNSEDSKSLSSILFEYECRLLNIQRAVAVCGGPVEKSNQVSRHDFISFPI